MNQDTLKEPPEKMVGWGWVAIEGEGHDLLPMSPQEGVPAAGGVGVVGGVAGVPAAEVAGAAAPLQLDAQLQLAPVIAQHQLGGVVVEGHQQRTVHWVSRLYTRSGQDITQ